LFHFSVDLTDN